MTLQSDLGRLYDLSQEEIFYQLNQDTLSEAQQFYQTGHVSEPSIEGSTLHALVEDHMQQIHVAEVSIEDRDIYIGCSCGYLGPGACAHVGALLLAWLQQRTRFAGYQEKYEPDLSDPLQMGPAIGDEYREALSQQTINELRALAQRQGVTIRGTRKEPIVDALVAHLCDLQVIRTQIAKVDALTRELMTYLHLTLSPGYGFTSENIVNGLAQKHSRYPRRVLLAQILSLTQQGLLLAFKRENTTYYSLPQAVRACLPPRPGFIPGYPAQELDKFEIRERPTPKNIQLLYAVWNTLSESRPRRQVAPHRLEIEDRWPQLAGWEHLPEEIQEIAPRRQNAYHLHNGSLTVPAPAYHLGSAERGHLARTVGLTDKETEFYYMLLEDLGAISAEPGDEIVCHREAFERILSMPPSLQMHVLTYTWIMTATWSEMNILIRASDNIRLRRSLMYPSFKPRDLYQEWRSGRQAILRFLSTIQEGEWVSLAGFLRTIFEISPGLVHTRSEATVWWLESRKTKKQFSATYEDWLESSGRFVLAVLEGPLSWFGAISLGYREGKLEAFKVTPVGSLALQRRATVVTAEPEIPPEGSVELEDDLTVTLVPGQAPTQLHDLLYFIGTLQEAAPERFVYQITAEGVLQALEQGQTIESLIDRIGSWCGTEVPALWKEKMHAWSENYGKLHVYDDITLIELADDYALQELISSTSLRDHLVHSFSGRLVAICPEAVDDLIQEMEKRGYTPHVE